MAESAVVEGRQPGDPRNLGAVEVFGGVRRSDQVLGQYQVAEVVVRTELVEGNDLVARVGVGMCRWDAAEGRCWWVVRCIIPVSSWVVDRRRTRADSNRMLEGH